MVAKGTLLYPIIKYCGECGERKKIQDASLVICPDCNQRFRTKPRSKKLKDKYLTFEGY
jgi:DNA-directed RNA polymerase subunit RPC12/RpoP